ncbi:MAG: UDP-N-acetylmuramoyl-tripeptide--D-alanyl-D-alanine ligase [Propioniciclava sp.]
MVGPDVVIDSRQVTPGALFVALPGERVDGHDFVTAARDSGASVAVVSRELDAEIPQLVVADPQAALTRLATAVVGRERRRGMVVMGVTGSAGKTSTKDLLAHLCESLGPTVAPPGSYNNEIGTPLTACRVDRNTTALIVELGARGIGHVAALTRVVSPSVGVVLNVGTAHVGEFGSVDAIAQAKGELVEALPADGWAVLNADDARVLAMGSRTHANLALYSRVGEPSGTAALRLWASDLGVDSRQRPRFRLHLRRRGQPAETAMVSLRLVGHHQVMNALAAAGAAAAAGMSAEAIGARLNTAQVRSPWRMELSERSDGLVILNDAYNANPEAMVAALETLAELRRPGCRTVAVLGDMLELGEQAPAAHRMVGAHAAEVGVDLVVAVGEYASVVVAGFEDAGRSGRGFESREDMTRHLRQTLLPTDVVLLKASRGVGLEHVARTLMEGEGVDS